MHAYTHFRRPCGSRCFTMVELIVVIAIIAVLASLLLGSLSKSLATARRIACVNNLKQLSMAIVDYGDESDGYWPYCENLAPGSNTYPPSIGSYGPHYLLWDYSPDARLWVCPSDEDTAFTWHFWGARSRSAEQKDAGSSYMFSEQPVYQMGYAYGKALRPADITRPETYAYLGEGKANVNGFTWQNLYGPGVSGSRVDHQHLGRLNFLYGDLSISAHPFITPGAAPGTYVRSDPTGTTKK